MSFHAAGKVHDSVWCIIKRIQNSLYKLLSWWKAPEVRLVHLPLSLYSMLYYWPQCLWAIGNDPPKSRGEAVGAQGTSKTFFRKVSKQFCRRLHLNTAYPKRTRRHTLPSRFINFKDKKSLIFDFILSLSLSQLRAIARRHVSHLQKHQYRFFFHWGFHKDQFWFRYFFNLHQWFATFYTKFWNWYVCRGHYHHGLQSSQAVTPVKVYNSHYRRVWTMQIAGSALTGWSAKAITTVSKTVPFCHIVKNVHLQLRNQTCTFTHTCQVKR